MKNLRKIAFVGLASILAISLSSCGGGATTPTKAPTDSKTASLPSITLPSSFYDLTTTNKIIVNDSTVNIKDKSLSTSDLETVTPANKYVVKFLENEKWIQLKTGSEDITKTGMVEDMESTPALNEVATKSLQAYLADDNYYHLDLWYAAPPQVDLFRKGVANNTIQVKSVILNTPSPEEVKKITATVKFIPYSETEKIQAHTEVKLSPDDNSNFNFAYKYNDNGTLYESPSTEVKLDFVSILPISNPTDPPLLEWSLIRVVK